MTRVLHIPPAKKRARRTPLPLANGDRLAVTEFLRRYEHEHDLKKAELIEGAVHMPSPVRADQHALPDGLIGMWLGTYAAFTPGVQHYPNATLLLAPGNCFQPDSILCQAPQPGGKCWLNAKGYLCGAPELVCEISASTASIDLHAKKRIYRRAGVAEYIVWRVLEDAIDWFTATEDGYEPLAPTRGGLLASQVFPGLVLDVNAALAGDRAAMLKALEKSLKAKGRR